MYAFPVYGKTWRRISSASLERFSIAETAREIARTSPARTCSAQFSTETVILCTKADYKWNHRWSLVESLKRGGLLAVQHSSPKYSTQEIEHELCTRFEIHGVLRGSRHVGSWIPVAQWVRPRKTPNQIRRNRRAANQRRRARRNAANGDFE